MPELSSANRFRVAEHDTLFHVAPEHIQFIAAYYPLRRLAWCCCESALRCNSATQHQSVNVFKDWRDVWLV
tara:strand:- start:573 stop:785 length:213 start_codon:yes stop_codon:yes gene_type:complete